jgi:hypothetical protein
MLSIPKKLHRERFVYAEGGRPTSRQSSLLKDNLFSLGLSDLFRGFTPLGSFIFCQEQNIAGLTSQGVADFLQRFKINADCLALF